MGPKDKEAVLYSIALITVSGLNDPEMGLGPRRWVNFKGVRVFITYVTLN